MTLSSKKINTHKTSPCGHQRFKDFFKCARDLLRICEPQIKISCKRTRVHIVPRAPILYLGPRASQGDFLWFHLPQHWLSYRNWLSCRNWLSWLLVKHVVSKADSFASETHSSGQSGSGCTGLPGGLGLCSIYWGHLTSCRPT